MSVLTSLLLRGLTGSARRLPVPRAKIHSMPPEEELGIMVRNWPGRAREAPWACPFCLADLRRS
ncbi:PREDICTED: cytochrome c oxidase subunit 8A, mitochondrial [Rhinopithecus bieti]|uniref:cytochrome c oxidase subunit 8A, mitochondrial n=1 Tax=Rhinopithecus bieti TaxID=61621 RepID=UPI00083C0502|nr:PREDICTED: cytochrome c oxidase subunit 8A, mitochondrial [Rhinopithecus bieti]